MRGRGSRHVVLMRLGNVINVDLDPHLYPSSQHHVLIACITEDSVHSHQ